MGRGMISKEVQEEAKEFLGREITTTELRLYPYLDFVLKNSGELQHNKVNQEENKIMDVLEKEGHLFKVSVVNPKVFVTKEFYIFMNKVLYISYVQNKLDEDMKKALNI